MTAETVEPRTLDADVVRQLCGDILDWRVAAIVETGASVADLETALAWLEGESDAMGEERRPLAGAAGEIYDLLVTEEDITDEP